MYPKDHRHGAKDVHDDQLYVLGQRRNTGLTPFLAGMYLCHPSPEGRALRRQRPCQLLDVLVNLEESLACTDIIMMRGGLDIDSVLERFQGTAHLGRQLEVPVFTPPAGDFAHQRRTGLANACLLCARVGDRRSCSRRTPGTVVLDLVDQDVDLLRQARSCLEEVTPIHVSCIRHLRGIINHLQGTPSKSVYFLLTSELGRAIF